MGSPLGIPISAKPGMRSYQNYGRSVASSDQGDGDNTSVVSEQSINNVATSERSVDFPLDPATLEEGLPCTQRTSTSEVSEQLGQPGSSEGAAASMQVEPPNRQVEPPTSKPSTKSRAVSRPLAAQDQASKPPASGSTASKRASSVQSTALAPLAPGGTSADTSTRRTSERIASRPPPPPDIPAALVSGAPPPPEASAASSSGAGAHHEIPAALSSGTSDQISSSTNTKKRGRDTKSAALATIATPATPATPAGGVKVEKTRSELTRAEHAARNKNFVTLEPTEEHVAKARDLYAQAENYTVATYNQPLGQQIGDLLKLITDQGRFAPEQGKRLSGLPGQSAAQFLPKASWCECCLKEDRTGIPVPCMVEASATRCIACAIESVYAGVDPRRLCSFRTTQWTSQAVHANATAGTDAATAPVEAAPLGGPANPIECPDSEDDERADDEPGSKRQRVAVETATTSASGPSQAATEGQAERNPERDVKPKVEPLSRAVATFNKELEPIVKEAEEIAEPMARHKVAIQKLLAKYKLTPSVQQGKERAYLLGVTRDFDNTLGMLASSSLFFDSSLAELRTLIDRHFPDRA